MLICPLWSKLTPYRKEMIVLNSIIFCLFVCYPFESLFNESGIIVEVIVPYHCSCSSQSSPSCMSPIAESEQLFSSMLSHPVSFASISIVIVSNVSYKEFRGTIMGLSQTIGGLGRFIVGVCWLGDERVLR